MTWTLYRGADSLGAVHKRSVPEPRALGREHRRQVNAVLVPDPAYLPLASVTQHVLRLPGSELVLEHRWKPSADRRAGRAGGSSSGAVGVWEVMGGSGPLPPGVPPEQQFVLRDENGDIVPTTSIGVLEFRPDPAHPSSELASLPEGAFVGGSVWLVHFTQDLNAPTP